MHKIGQWGGFLGRILEQLLKTGFPLTVNVLKPLAKSVFMSLGLTAAAAKNVPIHKKKFGSSTNPSDIPSLQLCLVYW